MLRRLEAFKAIKVTLLYFIAFLWSLGTTEPRTREPLSVSTVLAITWQEVSLHLRYKSWCQMCPETEI